MSFSGDTFTRLFSWVVNAGNGIKIRSDYMDQDTNDIANGLTTVAGRITTLSTASLKQDGGGNVGIGGTAAGWVGTIGLQAPGDVALAAPFNIHLVSNAYSVSGTWKYLTTGGASRVTTAQGVTTFFNAASGTAGNNITWAQAAQFDANGSLNLTTGTILHNSTTSNMSIVANGTLVDNTARIELYDTAHATFARQIAYRADTHTWTKAQASVPWMTLTAGGSLVVGSILASNYDFSGRAVIQASGSTSAILGLSIGGSAAGYVLSSGTDMLVQNNLAGNLNLGAGGVPRVSVQANGATAFSGAAATVPNRLGNTSGAVTLDCTKSNVFTMTLTGNMTSLSITNITDGQTINVIVTQDGTGSRTWAGLTSANGFLWAGGAVGVLSTPGGSRDILCLTFDSVAGKFFCTLAKAFA